MREIHSVEIRDEAQVGMARRAVHNYAARFDFTEMELAQIDIVVQEIGTNAVRYATDGGWLHFTSILGSAPGLELFYWDTGPGIYNIDRAVRDGVSTSGSLGSGLGAIGRLMDEFEVYSTVRATGRLIPSAVRRTSHGTVLLARKWVGQSKGSEAASLTSHIGVWSRPHPGETVNGDAYFMCWRDGRALFAVIDGLGHGRGAREAADVALNTLDDWMGEPLDELLMSAHHALHATRGAVIGAAVIDYNTHRFYYAGIGNIAVRVFGSPEPVSIVPANGLLGGRLGKVRVWSHQWKEGMTLIMTSDGLSETWDINSYPDLLKRSPQLLAGILMRDYARKADDATVLVVK